jgi:hypothetical protein
MMGFFDTWFFDSWLGFLGCIGGLVAAAVWNWPPLRSAAIGFAIGIVAVITINLISPSPATCLQSSKGWDILRAYKLCS